MEDYPRLPIVSMQVGQYPYLLAYLWRRLFRKPRIFHYNGREYTYFEHPYNRTWMNERAVEIPIVWELVQKHPSDDVLEVGNVLSHYFRIGHTVVDKYERGRHTFQQDVTDLDLPKRFALIVTVSTIEHVGWDEMPRMPGKHLQALATLKRHLAPDGILMVTFPLGYNTVLDEDLFSGRLAFDEMHYLQRLSVETWKQASVDEVKGSTYGHPFRTSNGLVIGLIRNRGETA